MVQEIQFTWDNQKASQNQLKHRISFNEATTAFYDQHARVTYDEEHSEEEERFILLGLSVKARLLIVVHCFHHQDRIIRIISARKASKRETEQYGSFIY